jgi:hypothetical protein
MSDCIGCQSSTSLIFVIIHHKLELEVLSHFPRPSNGTTPASQLAKRTTADE